MEFVSELLKCGILLGVIFSVIKHNSFFKIEGFGTKWMISLFILKVIVAYIGVYFFSVVKGYGKSSDIYAFYNDASQLYRQLDVFQKIRIVLISDFFADEHTIETVNKIIYWNKAYDYGLLNDNRTMIRLSLFIYLLGFKSFIYYLIVFSFIGFTGIIGFCKVAVIFFGKQSRFLLYILWFSPSILFFTSGIYKETLLLCFVGLLFYFLITSKKKQFLWVVIMLLFFPIKPYFFILVFPSVVAFFIVDKWDVKPVLLPYIGVFVLLLFSLFVINQQDVSKEAIRSGQQFNPLKSLLYKQKDFHEDALLKVNTTTFDLPIVLNESSSFETFLVALPFSCFSSFLYPSIFHPIKLSFLLFAIENTLILLIFCWILFQVRLFKRPNNVFIFMLFAGVTYVSFIGLISPVVGNLIRYKTPILPIVWMLLYRGVNIKNTVKNKVDY